MRAGLHHETLSAQTNGRATAVIDVEEDLSGYQIPVGAGAQVAAYTEHLHHLSLLRKILLRLKAGRTSYSRRGIVYDRDTSAGARLRDRPRPWRSS
jgi:hypothetical protein